MTLNTAYEDLLRHVLENGTHKSDRTGTGTRSVFGHQMRFDLHDSFPLITTKKVYMHGVVGELLWFLRGDTNVKWLQEHNIKIWNEWADADGNLGPIYSEMWRAWPNPDGTTTDQITDALNMIKNNPDSRRIIVTAWNPSVLDQQALPACHALFQFYVADGRLSCQLYQRSADLFLGVPFNIASYALLTCMMAQQAGLEPGEFVWTGGDCHIYDNHIEQVKEQLSREAYDFPTLNLRPAASIFDYDFEDIQIDNYKHHPSIKAPVAV